jgi:hypothetical protein
MADCDRRLFVGHGDAVVVQLAQVCLFVGIKCRISMSGRCTDDGCDRPSSRGAQDYDLTDLGLTKSCVCERLEAYFS